MIVYYQVTKNGEKKFYRGEDTHPFAAPDLLIVADGLGGRGGWPHTKVNKQIIEKDRFYDLVFKPVFEKEPDEELKDYIMGCFSEVFETADYYFKIPEATRSSGFFASRLVSSIVAYELNCDTDAFNRGRIFEAAKSHDEAKLQEYGDKLAKVVYKKLDEIAKNMNFLLESEIRGEGRSYLLPTTLQVALVEEREDCVDVVYFWAGDSRAYAWNKDGMALLNEDHEDEEIMTNVISLSEPFGIETRSFSMEKPCVLFNTSDGIYKGMTALELEYELMKAFRDHDGYDEAAKYLESVYDSRTKHDDSNTMALWAYGYETYADVQNAAKERLSFYEDAVFGKLPDIFEKDYALEKQKAEAEKESVLMTNGVKWIEIPEVKAFVADMLAAEGYEPFVAKFNERMEEESRQSGERKRAKIEEARREAEDKERRRLREQRERERAASAPAPAPIPVSRPVFTPRTPSIEAISDIPFVETPDGCTKSYKGKFFEWLCDLARNMEGLADMVDRKRRKASADDAITRGGSSGRSVEDMIAAGLGRERSEGLSAGGTGKVFAHSLVYYQKKSADEVWSLLRTAESEVTTGLGLLRVRDEETESYTRIYEYLDGERKRLREFSEIISSLQNGWMDENRKRRMLREKAQGYVEQLNRERKERGSEERKAQEEATRKAREADEQKHREAEERSKRYKAEDAEDERAIREAGNRAAEAAREERNAPIDEDALRKQVAQEVVPRFWRTRRRDCIYAVWEKRGELLPGETVQEAERQLQSVDEAFAGIKDELATRDEIYAAYETRYMRFFTPSKLKMRK